MAIKANIVIDQGTDFTATIDLSDAQGNPYDLQGFTAAAQMRKNYASTNATDFVTEISVPSSQIVLTLAKAETVDLDPGRYMYDVEITSSANTTTRVVEGIATVTPGITRV